MNDRFVSLQFAQLSKAWDKSKHNLYFDKKKKGYHEKLQELYTKLLNESKSGLSDIEAAEKRIIYNFFFKSLEFLDKSTASQIPFEIVYCLEVALKEWIDDSKESFIIVTSFVNDVFAFSFDESLATNNIFYDLLEERYSIKFSNRLIQINIPSFLSRDYLANVALYHELGHFIDLKYKISIAIHDSLLLELLNDKISGTYLEDLLHFFPEVENYTAEPVYYKKMFEKGYKFQTFLSHISAGLDRMAERAPE